MTSAQTTWSNVCTTPLGSDTECTGWVGPQTVDIQLQMPDCFAEITYYTRTCSTSAGVFTDYVITGMSVDEGCGGWDSETSMFHLKRDGLREYVSLGLIDLQSRNSAPECGQGAPATYANVYTAACGIWVYCEYELPPNPDPVCPDWQGPLPHFGTNPTKVRVHKWQSCGEACCRRTYSVCWKRDDLQNDYRIINLISKERLGDCTGQSNYSQPCSDGC